MLYSITKTVAVLATFVAWALSGMSLSQIVLAADLADPVLNQPGGLAGAMPAPQTMVEEPSTALMDISAYSTKPPLPTEDARVDYILSRQIFPGDTPCDVCACHCGGVCRQGDGYPHSWRQGAGTCDDWCAGPHWDVIVDGVLLRRENLDLADLETFWGVPMRRFEQFGYEGGARAYATGWNEMGYGIQLGYVGVDHWQASGRVTIPDVTNRDFALRSGIHAGELNILPDVDGVWRFLLGVRYAELSEDFYIYDVSLNDEDSAHVRNKMIGFQLGMRRDLWNYSDRFYVECLVNGGIYRNRMKRMYRSGTLTDGTSVTGFAEDNEIAFLGEAALTASYRLNECLTVRGGYQVLFVDGVMRGDDAILGPGLITGSLFYHGLHVGLEYRR